MDSCARPGRASRQAIIAAAWRARAAGSNPPRAYINSPSRRSRPSSRGYPGEPITRCWRTSSSPASAGPRGGLRVNTPGAAHDRANIVLALNRPTSGCGVVLMQVSDRARWAVDGQPLGDYGPNRVPGDVCRSPSQRVENRDRVGGHVLELIGGGSRIASRGPPGGSAESVQTSRSARIPVVKPCDVKPVVYQRGTEIVVPVVHVGRQPGDQQQRSPGVANALVTQSNSVVLCGQLRHRGRVAGQHIAAGLGPAGW